MEVITLGSKCSARVKSSVKLRSLRSIKGKEVSVEITVPDDGEPMGKIVEVQFLPPDTIVQILAKTEKKEKVDKWENYWYYAEIQSGYDRDNYIQAWLYCEFLEIK